MIETPADAPLAITTGDPGGVGPEVSLRAAASLGLADSCVLYGDADVLADRARAMGLDPALFSRVGPGAPRPARGHGLRDVGRAWGAEALRHEPTAAGGAAALAALDAAIADALAGRVRAIVTAPMSKAAVNLAGFEFTGHTEHLAAKAGLADDDVTMMFLGPRLRVALVTTHVAIAALPHEIREARVVRAVSHLAQALLRLRQGGSVQRIVVAGLNPHAGEGGLFGSEELQTVVPAIRQARALPFLDPREVVIEGPIGAETAFRDAAGGRVEGVVAMMHDQATIASKLLDWTRAVNVTWGLPFVRTSVDHGVAYDAARNGTADAQGMISALAMARDLTADRPGLR